MNGASARRGAGGVAGRGVLEGGAQSRREILADEARVELAGDRQRRVGPGRGGGHEQAAVGQRLELGDAVVLAARRAHEHAGPAHQRAVVLSGEHAHDAHALLAAGRRRPARSSSSAEAPATTSSSEPIARRSARTRRQAASTRSSPFLEGLAA